MRLIPSRRCASLLVIAAIAVLAVPQSAGAVPLAGTWGTIPYLNGVICPSVGGSSALVSWPSAATAGPAFATQSVDAPAGGAVEVPATATAVSSPAADQPADRLAALAALIGRYGGDKNAAVVGDVAALVANDPTATACLAQGGGGVDATTAATLWRNAEQWAGPYTVQVTSSTHRLVLAAPATVTARVVSAHGVGVPGLTVSFTGPDPTATMTPATAVTDASGRASTTLTVASGSPATQALITATTTASTGLVEMTGPGAVSLVAVAPPQQSIGNLTVPVDVTADPTVVASVSRALVLAGTTVQTTVLIGGMNGHAGTATVSALGPLPFQSGPGCSGYPKTRWDADGADHLAAQVTPVAPAVPITGDGTYPAAPLVLSSPGCYLLRATVTTVNAEPNVTARSADTSGQLVTVPPVTVSESTAGHGVATAGPLRTQIQLGGPAKALLDGVTGTVRGPREPPQTGCPTTGWDAAGVVATLTAPAGAPARSVSLTSPPLTKGDCYAFDVRANIVLDGLGTIPVRIAASGTTSMLLVTPIVFVTGLSTSAVSPGQRLHATVTVYETLSVPGQVRLQLAHQPYTARGCFGLDWSAGDAVPLPADAPSSATTGDGSYTVESPAVPGPGCWTVEPVLTLDGSPTARVVGEPDVMSMVAFTSIAPPPALPHSGAAARLPDDAPRLVVAAGLALFLLVGAVVLTLVIARRASRDDAA